MYKACSFDRRARHRVLDDWLAEAFLGKPMTWGDDRALERDRRYLPFVFIWSLFELLILSFLLIPALATLQNRNWSTR
jgi:hypothetical protein